MRFLMKPNTFTQGRFFCYHIAGSVAIVTMQCQRNFVFFVRVADDDAVVGQFDIHLQALRRCRRLFLTHNTFVLKPLSPIFSVSTSMMLKSFSVGLFQTSSFIARSTPLFASSNVG